MSEKKYLDDWELLYETALELLDRHRLTIRLWNATTDNALVHGHYDRCMRAADQFEELIKTTYREGRASYEYYRDKLEKYQKETNYKYD